MTDWLRVVNKFYQSGRAIANSVPSPSTPESIAEGRRKKEEGRRKKQ